MSLDPASLIVMNEGSIPSKSGADEQRRKAVMYGRVLTGAALGAAFAASLSVVEAALSGADSGRALFPLAGSMPLLCVHLFATAPGHEHAYDVSRLMRLMPVFGGLLLVVGMSMLLETAVPGTGVFFGALSILCLWVCVQSNERALRQTARAQPLAG